MRPVMRVPARTRAVRLLLPLLTIVVVTSLGLTACTGDSPSETMITTGADSFRAVMTVSGTARGEEVFEQRAVLYSSPDSLSILPTGDWVQTADSDPPRSQVIIGDRGWVRRSPDVWWQPTLSSMLRVEKMFSLDALAELERFLDPPEEAGILRFNSWWLYITRGGDIVITAGPETAGEQTTSYRRHDAGFGSTVRQALLDAAARPGFELDDSVFGPTIEILETAEASYEIVVGAETRRVYRFVATIDGPMVDQTYEIVFSDYDQPVTIEPPMP